MHLVRPLRGHAVCASCSNLPNNSSPTINALSPHPLGWAPVGCGGGEYGQCTAVHLLRRDMITLFVISVVACGGKDRASCGAMPRAFCWRESKEVLVAGTTMGVHLGAGGSLLVSRLHAAKGLGNRERKIPQNAPLQREPRSGCIVLIYVAETRWSMQ